MRFTIASILCPVRFIIEVNVMVQGVTYDLVKQSC